jgi:hypothetical protein
MQNMKTSTLVQKSSTRKATLSYQVVHSTTGRIRLRISKIANDSHYTHKLQRSLTALPFVTTVVVNPKAMSVTIKYRANQVPDTIIKEKLARAIEQANSPMVAPHSTSALAKRLGVSLQSLNGRRSRVDFADWTQVHDPEGIAWNYDDASKTFHPVISIANSSESIDLQPAMFQTLGATAGGRVGGMVGKFTGEVLGLMVLGSVGMVVGAEVGALVGEVIGTELGTML